MTTKAAPSRHKSRKRNAAISAAVRAHAAELLETEFEYVFSPEFKARTADQIILAEMPAASNAKPITPPADTPAYLAELYRTPLLTWEQEHHLFRKMNYLQYRAETLRKRLNLNRPDVALIDQIDRFRSAALEVRNQIVNANLRLVVSIAKKLVDGANSLDDLISDGNLPLIRAAEIFDFTRGLRFSTYATWAVRNGLFRASKKNRRQRTRQMNGAEGLLDGVSDERGLPQAEEAEYRRLRDGVKRGLKQLEPRDRQIVAARFGLGAEDEPLKFREIAAEMNLSTERVRQLLARSLTRLQETVDPSIVDFPQQAI